MVRQGAETVHDVTQRTVGGSILIQSTADGLVPVQLGKVVEIVGTQRRSQVGGFSIVEVLVMRGRLRSEGIEGAGLVRVL